jgi:hypothetical protein
MRSRSGSSTETETGGESEERRSVDVDPRRAAAIAVPDPGPMAPPGPLDEPRPRRPFAVRSELRPDGPGGYKTDEGPFIARTDRQGRVDFEDRSSFRFDIPTPRRMARDMGSALERWARDPRRYAEENGNQSRIALGGQIELTDSIMRMGGQDPYAARKMEFLDRTRDERMRIAAAEHARLLRESLHRTGADLERVWRGPGSAAERRRLLFLLWDECLERGSAEEVRIARAVRGRIVGFVRRHLPVGSRMAYSAAELARLNAGRTSQQRFDPYAAPPP